MKPPLFSCLDSRVANNGSLYGRFLFGPLPIDLSLTVATVLRRSLLHSQATFTIVSAEIEGAMHEYASLPGIQESILEILLNLGEIVLSGTQENFVNPSYRTSIETTSYLVASLRISGPCIVYAKDINWPKGIYCVKPNTYIATLSTNETLAMRIKIACSIFCKKSQNHNIQKIKSKFSTLDFSKRTTKNNPAFQVSNWPNEDLAITNSSKFSQSLSVQDYTPSSSYSTRKRTELQINSQSQFKRDLNSFNSNPFLSQSNIQPSSPENKNISNLFISQTRKEEKKMNVNFLTLPPFTTILNPKFRNTIFEPLSKNQNQTFEQLTALKSFLSPRETQKRDFADNSFFNQNSTNQNLLTQTLKATPSLVVASSSLPVEKVNFLIERDDDLVGYRHRIIFEIWTNGSISPKQAIFDSIGSILKLLYSFREPVRQIFNSHSNSLKTLI